MPALRGGTVAGDHDVMFLGPDERLILSHRAESRTIFARGALAAARFLHRQAGRPLLDAGRDRRAVNKRDRFSNSSAGWPRPIPSPDDRARISPTPITLLVAVVLSAQATDVGVNKATRDAVRSGHDAAADARARRGGAARPRSRRSACSTPRRRTSSRCREALVDDHGGEVPRDRDALETLPGVGRKTANVVLNTAFGEETFAVDTHIFRVGNRTGLAPGKTVARGRAEAREGRARSRSAATPTTG